MIILYNLSCILSTLLLNFFKKIHKKSPRICEGVLITGVYSFFYLKVPQAGPNRTLFLVGPVAT